MPQCELTLIKQSLLWVKMGYKKEFQESIENPEKFWRKQAELIKWYEFPNTILSEDENGFYRWFKGGKLNTSYLLLVWAW